MKYLIPLHEGNDEHRSTRDGFGEALIELAKKDEKIVVLTADVAESTRVEEYAKAFSERFFDVGVSEQNLLGVATGLALSGKTPFATAYAVFSPGRNWDQLRLACYSKANIKIVGAHAGLTTGADGATHQALEDLSLTRPIPNLAVVVPADYEQAKKATEAIAQHDGPVYLRLGRENMPVVTTAETPFKLGEAQEIVNGTDVVVFACGIMLAPALKAAEELSGRLNVGVVNVHTLKPLDEKKIVELAKQAGAVVTAEEHQVTGGLGSAIAETLAEHCPVPMKRLGVQDQFGQSGPAQMLLEHYGLTAKAVIGAAEEVVKRKDAGQSS